MKRFICITIFLVTTHCCADTIEHYMNIVGQIPEMEMKADRQAQAWARSARTVLSLACDSIIDTIMLANEQASKDGHPLFCLPPNTSVTPESLDQLIQKTYKNETSPNKNHLTVSRVALNGLKSLYPCSE